MTQVPNPAFNPLVTTNDGKITREWLRVFNDILSIAVGTADLDAVNAAIAALQVLIDSLQAQINALHVPASGSTVIDFGAFPGSPMAQVSVPVTTNFGIVQAWVQPSSTPDHSADEHIVETLKVIAGNVLLGTGFTIYGLNTSPGRLYGRWNVSYMYQ